MSLYWERVSEVDQGNDEVLSLIVEIKVIAMKM
jgi:hypothetical protein